ncbi:MAG: DNA integrity scanning protein DisA nucleotide-binding domain protein [Deltaproteobacteria bacterium]|nr:DNA integrity scanning protein DisA nucleotide-binding domain protein [Deltaproteobacteria bacterium]
MIEESSVFSPQSCELTRSLLTQVTQLRQMLDEVERSLQERHLSCCVFPLLQGAEEVASAIHRLSANRIGALIAVERRMSLEDYAKSGTRLNAQLSASLLLSLFYPGNPLHDGAVIIRGDLILAAGCIFPLSANHVVFKDKALGTRHRAAVGLSQVSDAIVFVVSEETGRISLTLGGELFHVPLGESIVERGRGVRTGLQSLWNAEVTRPHLTDM